MHKFDYEYDGRFLPLNYEEMKERGYLNLYACIAVPVGKDPFFPLSLPPGEYGNSRHIQQSGNQQLIQPGRIEHPHTVD